MQKPKHAEISSIKRNSNKMFGLARGTISVAKRISNIYLIYKNAEIP